MPYHEYLSTKEYEAINLDVDESGCYCGILVLYPTEKEFIEVENYKVALPEELQKQKSPKLVLETNFNLY